jgi:hypothetical protein
LMSRRSGQLPSACDLLKPWRCQSAWGWWCLPACALAGAWTKCACRIGRPGSGVSDARPAVRRHGPCRSIDGNSFTVLHWTVIS